MSTDLVKIGNTEMTLAAMAAESGMDTVSIKPSNINLIQNMTQDPGRARPGQFKDMLTGEAYDSLTIVILKIGHTRIMFQPGAGFGEDSLCNSNDGVYPSPYAKEPQAASCALCPNSRWNGKTKPLCGLRRKMLIVPKETMQPCFISLSGTSYKPTEMMLETIKRDQDKNMKLSGTFYPMHAYRVVMTSEQVKGKLGSFFVVRYEDIKRLQDTSEFGPYFEEYVMRGKVKLDADVDGAVSEAQVESAVTEAIEVPWEPVPPTI